MLHLSAKRDFVTDTAKYNKMLDKKDREICDLLASAIDKNLPESENKIWHAFR